jgi:hypothetical protein
LREFALLTAAYGTAPDACDTAVLGRDVLNNFRLIFDLGRSIILLLVPPHDYDVVVR